MYEMAINVEEAGETVIVDYVIIPDFIVECSWSRRTGGEEGRCGRMMMVMGGGGGECKCTANARRRRDCDADNGGNGESHY